MRKISVTKVDQERGREMAVCCWVLFYHTTLQRSEECLFGVSFAWQGYFGLWDLWLGGQLKVLCGGGWFLKCS